MEWHAFGSSDCDLRSGRGASHPGDSPRSPPMAIKVRTSGCLFSIIASVVLTVLLNVLVRGCGG